MQLVSDSDVLVLSHVLRNLDVYSTLHCSFLKFNYRLSTADDNSESKLDGCYHCVLKIQYQENGYIINNIYIDFMFS